MIKITIEREGHDPMVVKVPNNSVIKIKDDVTCFSIDDEELVEKCTTCKYGVLSLSQKPCISCDKNYSEWRAEK